MARKFFRRRAAKKGGRVAKVPNAVKSYVSKRLDTEVEDKHLFLQTTGTNLAVGTEAASVYLGGWARGTAWGERLGQRLKLKYIRTRVYVRHQITDTANRGKVQMRCLFVQENNTNQAALTIANDDSGVFRATGLAAGDYPILPYNATTVNVKNSDQKKGPYYIIMGDKSYTIVPFYEGETAGSAMDSWEHVFKFNKHWGKGLYVTFDTSNAGNITDVMDHAHHIIMACSTPAAGTTIVWRVCSDICYQDA